jgi:murein L,D-transpeptidase YcbB/YkuD
MKFKTKYIAGSSYVLLHALIISTTFVLFTNCNNDRTPPPKKEIVEQPQQMAEKVPEIIHKMVNQVADNSKLDDSIGILQSTALQWLYEKENYAARWSKEQQWLPIADSFMNFIQNARLYGLFPEDYHLKNISGITEKFLMDSSNRKDAVLWSKADVLLTDALLQIINHIKLGRLAKDSITLRTDSVLTNEFYAQQLQKVFESNSITTVIDSLEPQMKGYRGLRSGIKRFLDSADFRDFTYVPNPMYDSAKFKSALVKRLMEDSLINPADSLADSLKISLALKKYQKKKKLTVDGKMGNETISSLNATGKEKFFRIALSLDKYKLLPAKMPERYIWVNLSGYYLQLWQTDTIAIYSKVVVGKPLTRTPELNSSISDMITYPQWTIPTSIIVKEILPGLKKDPGYLAKKGYSLLNEKNEEVDPYFVDWSKYKTGIPYKVVQGSGDDNALGVLKFNFPNKYAVYLHDTNQRFYFSRQTRSLSHGCVRVQEWQKLSQFILNNDSMYVVTKGKTNYTKTDSVTQWLSKKEKHYIPVRDHLPLFIRYFTCEGRDGKIFFYDDVYDEDHRLKEKYFPGK